MRTLVVDGYNVLRASGRYRRLAYHDLESARAALVKDVAAFATGTYRALVVFDGGANPDSDGTPHHVPGAAIVFSAHGVDADAVVESLAHRHRARGEEVTVVTSDAQTQWAVLGEGVLRMSAGEFVDALEIESTAWAEHTPIGSTRQTLDLRVDPEVRDALTRWARGKTP